MSRLQSLLLKKRQADAPRLLLEEAFPAQLDFIKDPSKRKAAFVLRRGGKSFALALYLLHCALSYPVTKSLYMGLTKESAENVMWLNILEPLLVKYEVPYKFNKTKRLLQFDNKSTIQLTGADASPAQMSKYLGGKYVLAVFDECQDIVHDLQHWIDDKLGPAMLDYIKVFPEAGTICCAGTAGRSVGRYWYHVTQPESPINTYSVHRWQAEDNPHMAGILIEEMDRLKAETPGIEKTEGFRNQYLCEWVLDNSNRVYHNNTNNILTDHAIEASLIRRDQSWTYIIGCDFGFVDATALVVGAYSRHGDTLYIVSTFRKSGMYTAEIGHKLQELKAMYKPRHIVGDCQNLQLVNDLRGIYKVSIAEADKPNKEGHIAFMNSDFITNKIKVVESQNADLLSEWAALIWDETKRVKGTLKELASRDNHAADACLYMHNFFCTHHRQVPEPAPDPHPMMTAAENRVKRQLDAYNNTYVGDNVTVYDHLDNILS